MEKQSVDARSSAEVENQAALITCEFISFKQLDEVKLCKVESISLIWDNPIFLHIAPNPTFHERTKHIETDCHYIRGFILGKRDSSLLTRAKSTYPLWC